jgi:hypothetical protein
MAEAAIDVIVSVDYLDRLSAWAATARLDALPPPSASAPAW